MHFYWTEQTQEYQFVKIVVDRLAELTNRSTMFVFIWGKTRWPGLPVRDLGYGWWPDKTMTRSNNLIKFGNMGLHMVILFSFKVCKWPKNVLIK